MPFECYFSDRLNHSFRFNTTSFISNRDFKKNLYDELFPEIAESYDSFQIEASYGTSLFVMNYPKTVKWNAFTDLQKLGCPIFLTFQMSNMKELKAYLKTKLPYYTVNYQ